ncbi:calphotin isoform X2 [Epinephelus fuscoguttatus]|uniref:calphotin isoform X2 n=1 Tax=Epinephelus fuscoguttatus TaxID=293821 RepID=UPI0020D0EB37|nr:calphotin isoform X2 [Epinephelus fuscoguttatus]
MEETLQQETQESEYKNPNEDQGGIRRRLRDRDLLRKRKAEAEEKETNQVERQRKRPRADGGTKRRGRPRKSEPPPEISVILEEAENPPDAPAVVVVPEHAELIPDQTPGSLTPSLAVEPTVLATPAPPLVFGSIQSPVFTPTTLTSPAFVDPTPASFSPSALAPSLAAALDMAPIPVQESPVQDSAPALAPAPAPDTDPAPAATQAPVPAADPAPPTAPPQVETFYSESQGRESLAPVLIEDLGPDEEEDIAPSQDKKADEELTETPLINVSEQNETFSTLTLTSTPPPQRYFPGF